MMAIVRLAPCCASAGFGRCRLGGFDARQVDRKARAVPDARVQLQRVFEQPRHAPRDRQAQAQAARAVARGVADLVELLEDALLLFGRDAGAAVPDLQAPAAALRAQRQQHAALRGVFERIGEQVAHQAFQQRRVAVGMRAAIGAHMQRQAQALGLGQRGKLFGQARHEGPQRQRLAPRRHHAGIHARDIEQGIEHAVERADRALHALGDGHALGIDDATAQVRELQPQGVNRLAQIVAGGGEEARLRQIRLAQCGVQLAQPRLLAFGFVLALDGLVALALARFELELDLQREAARARRRADQLSLGRGHRALRLQRRGVLAQRFMRQCSFCLQPDHIGGQVRFGQAAFGPGTLMGFAHAQGLGMPAGAVPQAGLGPDPFDRCCRILTA